jgi:hypothetical protein
MGSKKGGGTARLKRETESTVVRVALTVKAARALLTCMTSGTPVSQDTARAVVLAATRALTSAGAKKKKMARGVKS